MRQAVRAISKKLGDAWHGSCIKDWAKREHPLAFLMWCSSYWGTRIDPEEWDSIDRKYVRSVESRVEDLRDQRSHAEMLGNSDLSLILQPPVPILTPQRGIYSDDCSRKNHPLNL